MRAGRAARALVVVAAVLLLTSCVGGRPLPALDVARDGRGVAPPTSGQVLVEGGWPTVASFVAAAAADGEATVVNLFGSWCGPCEEELPLLLATSADTPGVRWLGVAVEDPERNARPFVEEQGVTWPTVLDLEAETHEALAGRVMPTTAFFDAEGRFVEVVDGIVDEERLRAAIARVTATTRS